jgi:hypothetical protein
MSTCQHTGCPKYASFNFAGIKPAKFCTDHKKEGMSNVKLKLCEFINCVTGASYNFADQITRKFCAIHKEDGMVYMYKNCCNFENCTLRPSCNFEGKITAILCSKHKKDGMLNVRSKQCEYNNCCAIASFNFEGETIKKFCSDHKKEGMVNIVKYKKCEANECKLLALYNFKAETRPIFCSNHKKINMILTNAHICQFIDCILTALFNFENEKNPICCSKHKEKNMIDVVHKTCLSEWCYIQSTNPLYEGYCLNCFINLFPDKPIVRNFKTKEKAMDDFVIGSFLDFEWIRDKIIVGGVSSRRPDLLTNHDNHTIIVECDENQHKNYEDICENKRLMELSLDIKHKNLIFIRFNPDSYIGNDNKKVASCWSINKKGILTVNRTQKKKWEKRLEVLNDTIEYWINNTSEKMIEVIKLFYDKCDQNIVDDVDPQLIDDVPILEKKPKKKSSIVNNIPPLLADDDIVVLEKKPKKKSNVTNTNQIKN